MNYQNNEKKERFKAELATLEDNNEILEILEDSDFKGNISLTYTRRPNAILSFEKEGDDVNIILGKDSHNQNKIVTFGTYSVNSMFLNGIKEKIGYLFSLSGG